MPGRQGLQATHTTTPLRMRAPAAQQPAAAAARRQPAPSKSLVLGTLPRSLEDWLPLPQKTPLFSLPQMILFFPAQASFLYRDL